MKICRYIFCGFSLVLLAGCATTQTTSTGTGAKVQMSSRYLTPDRRTVDIGRGYEANGGVAFKDPHLDSCWIGEGFKFTGYDTLLILPTESTAKFQADEQAPHETAKFNLVKELADAIRSKGVFANVVTAESQIPRGTRVLKMSNTIVEYAKGGGGARYWAGAYGAGQPIIRARGKIFEGDKNLFTYEGRRSGVSAGARMFGAFKTDVDIQQEDIRSLSTDVSDFMAAIAGKYQAKN